MVSPEVLQQAKQFGQHYTMEVVKDRAEGRIEFKLIPKDGIGRSQLGVFVDTITNQFCSQFYNYFGVSGKIIELE
jgi:hypothetical protein